MKRKLLSLFLICAMLLSLMPSHWVLAAEETEEAHRRVLYIANEERFLQFAEKCRIDSYSRDLTVILEANLDLSQKDFEGIPIFLGNFQGNHHWIRGLNLTAEGSSFGLFRFLAPGSRVESLNVSGTLKPQGSRMNIGGIAGENQGTIENCRFEGTVEGADRIGGIAGINDLQGIIENCQVNGSLRADHFLGGIAGENKGVIRQCINGADINKDPKEKKVKIESISMKTIAGTETTSTVTDIGGIAGTSIGVIRHSMNRGQIGYPHIGYNVGGIAGSQVGYIADSQNHGKVFGRKEVGGIVGQFEPIAKIEYEIDTLQILEQQLASASSLLNRASYNAQGNLGAIGESLDGMWESAESARKALDQIKPGEIPDKDSLTAAHNAFKDSIYSMHETMSDVSEAAGTTAGQLGHDLRALSSQMSAMSRTIREANEHMGITLVDASDLDTEEELGGKVENCENHGAVNGDINAGGIAGSIAYENDLDPEEDLNVQGDRSLNFEGSLRAVILSCENSGPITAKHLQAGGIAGWMALGLAKDCVNTGKVQAEKAQFVGGIAGNSRGYIRNCSVKCVLWGTSCIGGIAGSGTIVTDCLSMVGILSGSEKMGAILGMKEAPQDEKEEAPIEGNLYMSLSVDAGAIDGVSYEGIAQPMEPQRFRNLPDLPSAFKHATLIFENEDGSRLKRLVLPIGTRLDFSQVPAVPQKEGNTSVWKDLQKLEHRDIYFDRVFVPEFTPYRLTIASPQERANGRPILLAEGRFPETPEIITEPLTLPVLPEKAVLECWSLPDLSPDGATIFHYNPPEHANIPYLSLYIQQADGSWVEKAHSMNGSSLVFSAEPGDQAFSVTQRPDYRKTIKLFSILGILILLLLAINLKRRISKKKSAKATTKS